MQVQWRRSAPWLLAGSGLALAGEPSSFALRIDVQRMVPWDTWPWPRDGPVRALLQQGGQAVVVAARPAGSFASRGSDAGLRLQQGAGRSGSILRTAVAAHHRADRMAGAQAAGRLLDDDPPALADARRAMTHAATQARRAADVVARMRRLVEVPEVALT